MEESLMDIMPRLEKRTHYLATFATWPHCWACSVPSSA